MGLSCPYSKNELLIGLSQLPEEFMTDENSKKVQEIFITSLPNDLILKKKVVAEAHGISVADLINSPNYKELVAEYELIAVQGIMIKLKELGITDAQAWAFVMNITGNLTEGDME